MATGSPAIGLIVKVLDCPGAIVVAQSALGISVQLAKVGGPFSVTFCPPLFVTVTVTAAGCVYPSGRLPKFGDAGDKDIEAGCVTVNVGVSVALAPLPVMLMLGACVPTGSPAFGLIAKVLDCPGVIAVVQFAPGTSVQLATDGKALRVTFCPPLFVTVTVTAAGCVYPSGRLPKLGDAGDKDIETGCVTVNVGVSVALAPLPVMLMLGACVPTGSPAFGLIVNVLDCPGVIAVVQFAPGVSVQLVTDGSAPSVMF